MTKIGDVHTHIAKHIVNGLVETRIIKESDSAIFFVSVLIVIGAMMGITLLCRCQVLHMVLISGICSVAIGVISPIENEKRKLNTQEKINYKNNLLFILLGELVLSIILGLFKQKVALACVTMAIIVCLFLNVLEVLKRKIICVAKKG